MFALQFRVWGQLPLLPSPFPPPLQHSLVFPGIVIQFLVLVVVCDVGDLLDLGWPDDDSSLEPLLVRRDRHVLYDLLRNGRGRHRSQQRPQQQCLARAGQVRSGQRAMGLVRPEGSGSRQAKLGIVE